jgi:hypothetical protein
MNLRVGIICFLFCPMAFCHGKIASDQATRFLVDTSIKSKALQNVSFRSKSQWFDAHLNAEFYSDDTLKERLNDTVKMHFIGRYWWHRDTLSLTADIGDFFTSGFLADICRGKSMGVLHNVCAHENKDYRFRLTDSPTVCVEVPCAQSELIISGLPDSTSDEPIYGFVSFKSLNYYYRGDSGLIKRSANMSFYFRAINFDLYLKSHPQH